MPSQTISLSIEELAKLKEYAELNSLPLSRAIVRLVRCGIAWERSHQAPEP